MDESGIDATYQLEALLGEVEGIRVILASVERSATSVVLKLYCPANEVTRRLDSEHEAAFAAWTKELLAARKRGERGTDPPNQPGAFLNDLPLVISDDLGTEYTHPSKQAAGSGTEWEGMWTYKRRIPHAATLLSVAIDLDDCREHVQAIPL